MNRRDTVLGLAVRGATAELLPFRARAQSARKPYRIALLPDFHPALDPIVDLFVKSLAELGRRERRDFVIYRSGIFYSPDSDLAVRRVLDGV